MSAKRHPFRGLFGGLLLGVGLGLLSIVFAFAPLGLITPWVILVGAMVIGLLVGLFGPARGRRPA